ncbi:MAG: response regulator [Candidatus Eremiobacterota bacterium]
MLHILIADDEEMILELFKDIIPHMLKNSNVLIDCDITTTDNGISALEIVKEKPVDLVITNIRMPGIWGLHLTQKIKEIYPYMPIVIITGMLDIKEVNEGIELGVLDFWIKPFGDVEKFKIQVLNCIYFALQVKNNKNNTGKER